MASKTIVDPAKLYQQAHEAGMAALTALTPTPMIVSDDPDYMRTRNTYYVSEGVCGFAWVGGIRTNSKMGKWLVEHGKGRRSSYEPGVTVWVREGGQSYERKCAYAAAFAGVLTEAGVKCSVEGRLD